MSLFGEFEIPVDCFAFEQTFEQHPELVIDIERVVAADKYLTPYFWITNVDLDAFEETARSDPSVQGIQRLDVFDEATLYRGEWTDQIDTLVYAYTEVGASILEADGDAQGWRLRMRFDDRDALDKFDDYLSETDIPYTLERLYDVVHPRSGTQFGLTPKQHEALTTAWELGFFDLPREASMEEVATELDISSQALSDRLRRAHYQLIKDAFQVVPPSDTDGAST